jgi:hypothetical protein
VRCASAGAERPKCGLRADPAYVIPQAKKSHRVGGGGCARALAMYKPSTKKKKKKNIAAACFFGYTVHYR